MKAYELSSKTCKAVRTIVNGQSFIIPPKGTFKKVRFEELPPLIMALQDAKEIVVKEITDKE